MADKSLKFLFQDIENEMIWTIVSGSTTSAVAMPTVVQPARLYLENANLERMRSFDMEETIKDFSLLQNNWDSYNADKISETAISTALDILSYLKREDMFSKGIDIHVFPMRDGGIQFEFDSENSSCELEINPQGEMTFIVYDSDGAVWDTVRIHLYELSELKEQIEEAEHAE